MLEGLVVLDFTRVLAGPYCTRLMADLSARIIKVERPVHGDDTRPFYLQLEEGRSDQSTYFVRFNAGKESVAIDLEEFVRRFRAHKAKARQATSRMKQIEKLKVEDVKPSSRQYPYIRFLMDDKEKLHRLALEAKGLAKGYAAGQRLFSGVELSIEAGEKVAIIGPNGVGKTTLLRSLLPENMAGRLAPDAGSVKWAEKARPCYWPQDPAADFATDEPLTDWLGCPIA